LDRRRRLMQPAVQEKLPDGDGEWVDGFWHGPRDVRTFSARTADSPSSPPSSSRSSLASPFQMRCGPHCLDSSAWGIESAGGSGCPHRDG
jgi:hypothetical protein